MKSRLVLVADDDPDTVEAYAMLFRSRGHAVEAAADGHTALLKALDLRPDVMVLDLGLPLMGGLEVLRQVREQAIDRLPVLVLTGHAQPEVAAAAREEGADDVIVKPCPPLDLCARVEMLIGAFASPADGPPSDDDPSSGRIRLPRPRYERYVSTPCTAGVTVEDGPWLMAELTRTARRLERRAARLRDDAASLRARAEALRARVQLPWRGAGARGLPLSE